MLNIAKLKEYANEYCISLNDEMCSKMDLYAAMLSDWTKRINLTALSDHDDILVKHYIDSMLGARYIPQNARLVDVGTGGGFPGTVLKIIRPDISLTLMDSIAKKLNFVEQACRECSIDAEFVKMR